MTPALLAIVALAAQETTVHVTITTNDGTTLVGTTDVTAFTLDSTVGKVDLKLADIQAIVFAGDVVSVHSAGGTTLRGKLSTTSWKVKTNLGEFTVKSSDLSQVSVRVTQAPVPIDTPKEQPRQPAPTEEKPEASLGLAPLKTLSLKAALADLTRSADGKQIYALDVSESKVVVIDLESMTVARSIAVAEGAATMAALPDGTTVAAAGRKSISVVDAAGEDAPRTFEIEHDITDIHAADGETLYAVGPHGVMVVSLAKQAVVHAVPRTGGWLTPTSDGRRIYTSGGTLRMPDDLAIGTETSVRETENVFAAGFPFGSMLAGDKTNPEISVSKVAVSSIRKDKRGSVTAVQLSGDLNPGNSGGPVVDGAGKVVGVAQSKIFGSATAFAVPSEEIQGFLKGRLGGVTFKPSAATETSVTIEVRVDLIDPLATVRRVAVAVIPDDQVRERIRPDEKGR